MTIKIDRRSQIVKSRSFLYSIAWNQCTPRKIPVWIKLSKYCSIANIHSGARAFTHTHTHTRTDAHSVTHAHTQTRAHTYTYEYMHQIK